MDTYRPRDEGKRDMKKNNNNKEIDLEKGKKKKKKKIITRCKVRGVLLHSGVTSGS